MATTKEKLPVLRIKASSNYIRQVAITYRRSTSVVKNLKFLTPFFIFLTIINIILSTNCSYVISPYNINNINKFKRLNMLSIYTKRLIYCLESL